METRDRPDCGSGTLVALARMLLFVMLIAAVVVAMGCGGRGRAGGGSTPTAGSFNIRVKYSVQVFKASPGGFGVDLLDINDNGEILGQGLYECAVYRLDSQALLRGPFDAECIARLNEKGQAVGGWFSACGPAVLCESSGAMVALSRPDGYDRACATCINNNGGIVGYVSDNQVSNGSRTPHRPMRWSTSGAYTYLPLPAGFANGDALAVNDSGSAVGWVYKADVNDGTGRAIVWKADGAYLLLSGSGGASGYKAYDINNAGQILGEVQPPRGIPEPVIWDESGSIRFLGVPPGFNGVEVCRISDTGFCCGASCKGSGREVL